MDINGNLKTPCNIYGICGYKQSGKNTVAKIWGILDFYYKMGKDYWVKYAAINEKIKEFTDIDYVLNNLQFENKNSNWQEKSFAHSLKKILCILYGFKIEDFESEEFKSKELPEAFWYWYMELDGGYGPIILPYTTPKPPKGYEGLKLIKPTPRMLLQKIGTDLFRNQLHPNWSINALFSEYKPISNLSQTYPNILITDVRFQNEADAVTERGGKLIKVEKIVKKVHESETSKHVIHAPDTHPSETELEYIKADYYISVHQGDIENLIKSVKEIMIEEGVIKV